ncbi:UDP-N-acetylglucosamine--N-acetylmuramyl-(pentapeptide) pyrophosphoryl-undecaprenol N-acetylglucosamine transferase [Patescibacteria group bacterium]|nr:UDP-N-acetylglucosamine--N-acetylmuramyl-(pentapeptide) pyrophosphoryl-undecaprenol N-acetylglucosamine transferase [Patescibacteria group bacterium]
MKILLAGGGTLGSVSPLIAIWQSLKNKQALDATLFVGTKNGPEQFFLKNYDLSFVSLPLVKFRRYFSLQNILDIFKFFLSLIQSFFILKKFKPDVILSAGGFTAVPLIWISIFFKVKVVFYQLDLKPGLANKLCQKRANLIFTAFKETVKKFPLSKTNWAGSVIRQECQSTKNEKESSNIPSIMLLGGSSGAKFFNNLVIKSLRELTQKYFIIHITGKDKKPKLELNNYVSYELLTTDLFEKIAQADLIISRAGLATLMELSHLEKAVILIPLPNSAQTANAQYFCDKNAAYCLQQKDLTADDLIQKINKIFADKDLLNNLRKNIKNIFPAQGEEKIAQAIIELCK